MKMRLEDKFKALELRCQGKTYSEIRAVIPNLSKGTLCGWVKNIELTLGQKKRILEKIKKGGDKARATQRQRGAWTNHLKRVTQTKKIILEAKKETKKLSKNPFFLMGLMLYWAEGDKSLEREVVRFTNSDPLMIRLMMEWFRKICRVPEKRFRIILWIHVLHCRKDVEDYWSQITKIPLSQFNKTIIKPTTLKFRKRPLYNGTCAIRICDKNLFRKIIGWKLGVLRELGFKTKMPR